MTRKQLVLKFFEKLPEDVSYDRMIYHLGVMRAVEIGTEELERGEGIDHEELVAELLGENAQSPRKLVTPSKARPAKNPGVHRAKRAADRREVRSATHKSSRQTS